MKKAAELREQVLLLRCQIGDRDAFEVLFEHYERPLRYFINRLLDNSELTEDIFQDTWLTVIRRIHGLKEVDAFPAWLYRIARNKVYQQLRKKKNALILDENITIENHIEDDVFSVEDAAKIHRCLKELPLEYREVLMLRFLEQMSYQQIAQVLNCKLGTVRSRIYYAKIALRRELEK
jgi:RNA polymerase sigma-70 factor (ECF subfamily)